MRLNSLTIAGLRGFSDEQTLDFTGNLVIYSGPNGSGKTSIGEAIEWLLFGKTLKRVKGDEISKREYAGSYRNTHYRGSKAPFVKAEISIDSEKIYVVRRELNPNETSSLFLDGNPIADLRQFSIGTLYDRPLILQHTLQDFIFMRPKMRYEVLSTMLGLEPLIDFRKAAETAKAEFLNNLPSRASDAQRRSVLLLGDFERHALLKPVAVAIRQSRLDEGQAHLLQVALGRVPSGTPENELLPALRQTQAAKQRAKLDWGRFSVNPITEPQNQPGIAEVGSLEQLLEDFERAIAEAVEEIVSASQKVPEASVQQFYQLGLKLVDSFQPERCPFCLHDTLDAERLAEIKKAVQGVPKAQGPLAQAQQVIRDIAEKLRTQYQEVLQLFPSLPTDQEKETIKELSDSSAEVVNRYLDTCEKATEAKAHLDRRKDQLDQGLRATEDALKKGEPPANGAPSAGKAFESYSAAVNRVPTALNAYAAAYAALDPKIRSHLASEEDVRLLQAMIDGLERWSDFEISAEITRLQEEIQDLTRETRKFIGKKQREILGERDTEIRSWYQLLYGNTDVGFSRIVPGTDNLELQARTFTKAMMAAPNLSQSQLNCVGLAIYLATCTRKHSPFNMVLFDDPIQSMDDEHTEAFKKQIIRKLLDEGFQVILLTHMDGFAHAVEQLYRKENPVFYRMSDYTQAGPNIVWEGPEIRKLLNEVKKNKDSVNEGYRKQAVQSLRQFVERFVKDFYTAETGNPVSKKYQDKSWGDLKNLLRQCQSFDSSDEVQLHDTHNFTSPYLHTDGKLAQKVPSAGHINPHYDAMKHLSDKYGQILGLKAAP